MVRFPADWARRPRWHHHGDVATPLDLVSVTRALEGAGCVAADEEAEELIAAAPDDARLAEMLSRRLTGEPLAWITGHARFCGLDVAVDRGVYVPRWQSEPLARRAAGLLPAAGLGVDLGTGSGAVALVMRSRRPEARVAGTEIDPVAARCARRNGVVVYRGDLDQALPAALAARVDVLVGVLPYVPDDALHLLPRDVRHFEPRRALDGGARGTELIAGVVRRSPHWLKGGGWLLLEVGGDQVPEVTAMFTAAGLSDIDVLVDGDGDPRGLCGRLIG
jgi:release factor glutamine methyltransferase